MAVLTDTMRDEIRKLFGRYPSKQAVTLPACTWCRTIFATSRSRL